MKRTHCLTMTFVAFFLSLSFLTMFIMRGEKDCQDPWLSDLHPPRLSLLTQPFFLRTFHFYLPSTPSIETQAKKSETPALQVPLKHAPVILEKTPELPSNEGMNYLAASYGVLTTDTHFSNEASFGELTPKGLDETQEHLYFHETEGIYFGQYAPKLKRFLRIAVKKRIQRQVEKAAMEIGVDPRLAKAIAAVESGYNQRAVSPQGAIGVLQLMPRFFCRDSELTPEMLFDPDVNIRVGLTHLKALLEKFNENIDLSLAAYNAGAQRVIDAGHTIPPFEQTQNYVRKVKKAMGVEDLDWPSMNQS